MCECKRRTTRHLASSHSAVLSFECTPSCSCWGYPILSQWGYPIQSWLGRGTMGYLPYLELGYPPGRNLVPGTGVPWKGHGTSGSIIGWRWGTLPPWVWTDTHLWKQYLPHPPDAGVNDGKKVLSDWFRNIAANSQYILDLKVLSKYIYIIWS